MGKVYSDKQLQLLRLWQRDKLKRINVLEGSVSSGKTWISLVLWAFWVATMPKDGSYLMVAKTLTSLKRNCLDLLQELVGTNNFTYSLSKKEGRLFGRRIYLEGVNDARAESKIRGLSLTGAYCDELTLFTRDFFSMLLSRLRLPGAKLISTTNPDSPNHWLKVDYIDKIEKNGLDMMTMKFLLEDNIFLDEGYIENTKKEHVGVFYDRFILGLWVLAQGRIYPNFDKDKHVVKAGDIIRAENEAKGKVNGRIAEDDGLYYISIDYGTANPCSMGLWRIADDKAVRVKEYYYSSRETEKQLTDEEYHSALVNLAGDRVIQYVVVDPSAASFIETISRHGKFDVRHAVNDVLDGIRVTASLLNAGKIFIDESCEGAKKEFAVYSWDEKAIGEDKPLKANDHAMDDTRYFVNTVLRREFKWDSWEAA